MARTQLVIIQPTSLCNIRCRYCYLPDRLLFQRMKLETLSRIAEVLFSSPYVRKSVNIVWHAGEPLVMPLDFYEEAFRILERYNTRGVQLNYAFQTNATLITQAWCEFFKQHNVNIGVSLDGPQAVHDANRVDWAGKGTFERVMRGIELLRRNEIPFSVIAVVTQDALHDPEAFWRFFMEIRPISLGLNAEDAKGVNEESSLQTEADVQRYKAFFKTLLALRARTPDAIRVREVDHFLKHIRLGSPLIRSQTNVPGGVFCFDHLGNISTFSPELLTLKHHTYGNFILGNVFEHTLAEALEQPRFRMLNEHVQRGVLHCMQSCDYFMYCGGGHPINKVSQHGTFVATETLSCRLRVKAPTEALLEHLEEQYQVSPSA